MYNDEKLKELRKEKKECLYSIKVKDGKTYEDLHKINNNIEEECKTVEEHSYFDIYSLGKVFSNIMTICEKERFVCREIICHDTNGNSKNMIILIPAKYVNNKNRFYDKNYLNSLIKYNNAIILCEKERNDSFDDDFPIYTYNNMYGLELNVRFKCFSYLKVFIDYVIEYKIDENLITICDEELEKLKDLFIVYNNDAILKRYEVIKYWDEDSFKERLEKDEQYYNCLLKRIKKRVKKEYDLI